MKGIFSIALMRKCDSIYCVNLLPSPLHITQLVCIIWFARNESAFAAVTYNEDKP